MPGCDCRSFMWTTIIYKKNYDLAADDVYMGPLLKGDSPSLDDFVKSMNGTAKLWPVIRVFGYHWKAQGTGKVDDQVARDIIQTQYQAMLDASKNQCQLWRNGTCIPGTECKSPKCQSLFSTDKLKFFIWTGNPPPAKEKTL